MARKSKRLGPKGYEFGTSGLTLLLASPKFIEDLREAQVVACSYGWDNSPDLGHALPLISLGGIHEQPLTRAFGEFTRWQKESQSQALDLTFVFLAHGGYLLSIGNRHESIARRLGRNSLAHGRLLCGATYIKQFDTRHPWLEQFREYHRQRLIAPFLFGACVVTSADLHTIEPHQVRRATGTQPLLSFQVEIADEREAEAGEGTAPWLALHVYRRDIPGGQKPPPFGPRDVFVRRAESLNRHFPVTLERVRTLEPYHALALDLEHRGIRRWQVEQAFCNLVLSASLCGGVFHYVPVRTGRLDRRISKALIERFEEADSKDLFKRTPLADVILRQVELDANALLRAHGADAGGANLPAVQRLLAEKRLLDES